MIILTGTSPNASSKKSRSCQPNFKNAVNDRKKSHRFARSAFSIYSDSALLTLEIESGESSLLHSIV